MNHGLYQITDIKLPKRKHWDYGYVPEHDVVVISRDGTVGEVYEINGLKVALPKAPDKIDKTHNKWVPKDLPKDLEKVKSIFEWNRRDNAFKAKWVDYIEQEFDRRDNGHWFMNNGVPTYMTGSHYMYLQWTKIDVGHAEFREANRIFFIFWEACKADTRSFGMCYLKNRRSGFSFMSSSEMVNQGTITRDSRFGILSKTGADAKKMFTDKVVPISSNYPFFFKPIQDGMDKPKTELAYRVPASKITRKNIDTKEEEDLEGLDTTIDWRNTDDNSYDGEKMRMLIHDECFAPGTKVLMEDFTFKPVDDISVGDRVIVDGGKVKTVVKKVSGETDRYLVKQPYGKDYVVTRNHRLVFNEYNKGEVVMTPQEYIESSKFRKQHLTRVVSKGIESADRFDGIPPYLFGLWLGDGRSKSFTILVNKEEEPEILHYLGRVSEMFGVEFELKKSDSDKIVEFSFKGVNEELRKIGVYNNKHIPEQYMMSSIESRLQLLAGIIETDGYCDKKKGTIEIGMSRLVLVEQIKFLAQSCGLSVSNVNSRKSNYGTDSHRISISGDLASIPMITEKKSFEGYSPVSRGRRNKVSVEYMDKGEFFGIQLDADCDDDRKLILEDFTVTLNSGKWEKPNNILNNWRVTKTCLRLGSKIIGKCMMGSTCNALDKGGDNFKKLYEDSQPANRNKNGQTKSGLYGLFIPMEWNFEGYFDEYGWPIFEVEGEEVMNSEGNYVDIGVVEYWNNEVQSLKSDSDALNEFYRQFPRTEAHAFRDESKNSLFNLTKIYQQIDYNDTLIKERVLTRGRFHWRDGKQDTEVIWTPDPSGRFLVSWLPAQHQRNNVISRNGLKYPGNEHLGSFGCDPYDISAVTFGRGSAGALHGMTKFHMDEGPVNTFFLEYVARPQTAEIFFEEILMAIHFYGMPILAENNKARLLYYLKERGYRPFSMNRPDRKLNMLSKTEKELGGIPNSSEDVKQAHATSIEAYIEKYVGFDMDGTYREPDEIGNMYFSRTLQDWARFDINNRTKYDAAISSGLALMANQKFILDTKQENPKISIKFPTYSNKGYISEIRK